MTPEINKFYTTEEVAKLLHCSTHYVTHLRQSGLLIGTRYGKRWLYMKNDLESFICATRGKDLSNFRDLTSEGIQKEFHV